MKFKPYKKGISLVALVITIVVTIILASVTVVSAKDIIENTKKSEFAKEVYTIQNLAKQYKFKENKYPIKIDNTNSEKLGRTIDLSTLDQNSLTQFSNEIKSGNTITLYCIDLYEEGAENVKRGINKNGDNDDIYLISETTGKVYYLKGEKISNNTYYTLDDNLKELVGLGK